MKPEILIFPDAAAAIEAHARQLVGQIAGLAATRGRVRLVLSGGSTPRPLYERLAREDLARAVPWPQVDVLLGDERHVPADHEHSNQRQARETLLDHLSEAPARFIAVDAKREHMDAARDFARRLGTEPVDVVLLGIGDDGHTASLFPGGAGFGADDPVALATHAPTEPRPRISLSLAALNRASLAIYLVLGAKKSAILEAVLADYGRPLGDALLPAARVRPSNGRVQIYTDRAAWGRRP